MTLHINSALGYPLIKYRFSEPMYFSHEISTLSDSYSRSNDSYSRSNGVLIILARSHLGLGALIHSTVNSIWLARKLGKTPYIWWGKSCIYTEVSTDDSALNTYTQLFQEPPDHQLLNFAGLTSVYPIAWKFLMPIENIKTLDQQAALLEDGQNHLDIKLEDSDLLASSDISIVCQYLHGDLALALANANGINTSIDDFSKESREIFSHYFKPHSTIQVAAAEIWRKTFTTHHQPVVGIHFRGTDKITETPLPSPDQYFRAIQQLFDYKKPTAFFIATDSQSGLEWFQRRLTKIGPVGTQDIVRSSGRSGIHFGSSNPLKSGIEMVIDIELLCKCQMVLAFPGSQIFWWLSRKQEEETASFTLISVKPSPVNWFSAIFFILFTEGWVELIQFLRLQRGGVKSLLLNFSKKYDI